MRITVFGGSGFLGSHVADALTKSGHVVTIYDLKRSPYLQSSQKMVVGDIMDEGLVFKTVSNSEIVYNFAGIADIDKANKIPLESIKCNIYGNAVILDACRKSQVKRYIFASSVYVYSKSGFFYRSTKQSSELIIENYYEVFGLPYTILRYGSLYGPRADDSNFICRIIKQALKEGKIVREGDGEEIREYIHVYDAAKSSVEILSEEFVNQNVIITGHQQLKVKDFLRMVQEIFGNKIKIEYIASNSSQHYEITPYVFMPKLAEKIINKTYVDLGQGILNYIQDLYQATGCLPENRNNNKFPAKNKRKSPESIAF